MIDYFPGVDPDRLRRRINFLESRARAHLEYHSDTEPTLQRSCAATLLRDAACVALFANEPQIARRDFNQAGRLFLEIGLAAGSTLIALSELRTARNSFTPYEDVIESTRHQWDRRRARSERESSRPMADESRSSPRQMLSLMQTDWIVSEEEPSVLGTESAMRAALDHNSGHPAGTTGLSIGSYSGLASWMVKRRRAPDLKMPSFVSNGFATIASNRAENIRSAIGDGHHWRLLPRPAELLDLDTVVLSFLAIGAGMSQYDITKAFLHDVPLERAPIDAAVQLRDAQDLRPAK